MSIYKVEYADINNIVKSTVGDTISAEDLDNLVRDIIDNDIPKTINRLDQELIYDVIEYTNSREVEDG